MVENHSIAKATQGARRTTRVTADLPDFNAFGKPFRVAVRRFLSSHARLTTTFTPPVLPCLMTWQILFRVGDFVTDARDSLPIIVALYVVEEDVTRSPRSVYCDQCRVVGWSGHPVCRKRYHFIMRSCDNGMINAYKNKSCPGCASPPHISESRRYKCCNRVVSGDDDDGDDIEQWEYSLFEYTTHLLHEVVHSNGYDHLLTVNGR